MEKVYLLLGGNMGDRFSILSKALERIQIEVGELVKESSFYETAPWGFEHNENFWNQVVIIDTQLTSQQVLSKTQKIENELGRVRTSKQYSARLIDIDILFYGDKVVSDPHLTIPHPRLQERMFTLAPLAEIAPDLEHPLLKRTIDELKENCDDQLRVVKIDPYSEEI